MKKYGVELVGNAELKQRLKATGLVLGLAFVLYAVAFIIIAAFNNIFV
jgi:hypothetical protein